MDDEPMWAADCTVAPTPGSAIPIPETANEFAIKALFDRILREIRAFSQHENESLTDAWLRMKEMLRNCHGHNLSKGNINKIFYHGLNAITQEVPNAAAGGIFLYKIPNQAYQLLKDKVLLKLDWAKNQKTQSSLKKTVAFADEGNSNSDTDKIMARMDAMTIKMDAPYKELQSRAKKPTPDLDDDDIPMSREEETKFMQIFPGMPNYGKFLKELISNKHKIEQIFAAFLSDESSAILQNKVPPKLGDPGSFLIPCNFNKSFSCNALADLGASINLMPCSLYAKLSLETLKPAKMSVRLADRSFHYPVGIAKNMLVEVRKFTFHVDFIILEMKEDIKVPLILERPFFHTVDAVIRVKQKQLSHGVGTKRMTFNIDAAIKHSYSNDDTCFRTFLEEEIFSEFDKFIAMNADENNNSESDTEEPPFKKITINTNYKIKTSLKEPHLDLELKPLLDNLEYRRLNPNLQVIKKEIVRLLDTDIIYPIADSPWVSHIHYVPKKGGITVVTNENDELIPTRTVTGWRVCIDYRKLNEATTKDHFPLPFMDQMLKRLAGNKYFCFVDGFSGYFQIPIDPNDQEKPTFTCPLGTYAYRRMPFELCNALATFQRCMLAIFHDMIKESVKVFMDDFSVFGNSFDKCLNNLDKMPDSYPDNDDYDLYDDNMYENHDLSEHLQSICDDLDITGLATGNEGLPPYPLQLGKGGVYSAGDVLNYSFFASRLQFAGLQTKLLRHTSIVASGPNFDDALCVFNTSMEIEFLSNLSMITLLIGIVPNSRLGQIMNDKTYHCVLCYRLSIPLSSILKPCSTCSRVFAGDIYGDHDVMCAGIIGIKHRHNVVRDTFVDICYHFGISDGKEVDIGLDGRCDKLLRPADMLLYSWDGGLDVCVDLTRSLSLTQTGMSDFIAVLIEGCRLQVHVTWAKNGNGRRLSTSGSGDMNVSFSATELSVRFRLFKTLCLLNYALMIRHDYDITSSLRRRALHSKGYSYPVCTTCGRRHPGECRRAAGTCFKCGQTGHLQKDCKKNTAASTSSQADKKPGASGCVFAITEDHATKTSEKYGRYDARIAWRLLTKKLYCMHNNVEDLIESALNSKLLLINLKPQRFDKEKHEVKNIVEQAPKRRTRITESLKNFKVIHKKSFISLNNMSQISSVNAIAPVLPTEEPDNSLSMGDEHLSTIMEMESNEVIKLVLRTLSQSQVSPSDDKLLSNEDVPMGNFKIYSNPLFVNEIISSKIDPHHFNAESDLIESLLNREISTISYPKIDSFLKEFSGELTYIDTVPPGIEEFNFDLEEEIRLVENLLYDNSSPRLPEELNAEIADTILESFSPSHIPNEDNDSQIEEIDLFLATDDLMPPGIEYADYDSEGDFHFLEELLSDDPLPLPENESSNFDHHDDLSFPLPPSEPPDVEVFFDFEPDTGVLTAKVMEDISEHYKLEEKRIEEEQAATAQNRKLPVCYDDDDDEEESNSLKDNNISELPSCSAVTPSEHIDSLSMGDEHLDTIPTTKSDEDAHIGNNCPSKVPVISNPKPCNNQTIDELPHTLPSFHPTFHSEAESPFTLDSTPAYVDESSNIFNPPLQTPVYPCEFYENDAYYGHYCTPPTPFIYPEPTLAKIKDQMTSITSLCEMACQVAQQKLEEKQIEEESESLDDNIISGLSPFSAITPDEPVLSIEEPDNSLSMGDEHLDTISATESDEVIKSGVENLIPIPRDLMKPFSVNQRMKIIAMSKILAVILNPV
nr:putative reverse transcriptase domain-containing protein [Tanacetum cinerariifolium]